MGVGKFSYFVAVGFGLLLVAASCANSGTEPGTDAGSDVVPIGPCGPGTAVKCGDTCVDTQSDSQNCGACGKACDSSLVCSHGACATVCATGTIHCGNDCIDQGVDVNNCGGCGKKCPSGNVCSQGSCALTCQASLTNCNGNCVDVTQNDDNCGACGSPCSAGTICSNGKCIATCQSGWTSCAVGDAGATTCVDTQNDPQNCNGCGTACPSGQFCSLGKCGIQCLGGTSLCSGKCVDESIDPSNCGGCNSTCGGTCSAGHCCSKGQVYCGACDSITNCAVKTGGALAAGDGHTCAINSSGVLKCWGNGIDGELGDNKATSSSTPVTPLLVGAPIFVGAGYAHTCAIVAGGKAFCWGQGADGEIGDGQGVEQDAPSAVSTIAGAIRIDGGGDQTCSIQNGGSLSCWGGDVEGDLGDNDAFNPKLSPISITLSSSATEIAAGTGYHTCAILSDTTVQCWGESDYGECGDNNPNNFEDDVPTFVVDSSNTKLTGATRLGLGYIHSCAVVSGAVWCWGDDTYGELGDDNTNTTSYVPVQAQGISNAVAIAAGGDGFDWEHTCAMTSGGAVYCWGSNDYGQCGTSTSTNPVLSPKQVIASGAAAIAVGERHSCAMMTDGTVYCWGYNGDGELGDGTNNDSTSPVKVTGF